MSEPVLRKLELQMAHQPSFLFWDLKGAVAERWSHGPHFGAVADQGNQITLQSDEEQDAKGHGHRAGVAGIMVSNFVWEMPPQRLSAGEVSVEWLRDCVTAFKPKVVHRIVAREQWTIALDDPDAVQSALGARYPEISEHVPSGYGPPYSGLSFNATRQASGASRLLSVTVGIIREGMSAQYFNVHDDGDTAPILGVFVDVTDTNPKGIASPASHLREASLAVDRDAQHVLSGVMGVLMPNG